VRRPAAFAIALAAASLGAPRAAAADGAEAKESPSSAAAEAFHPRFVGDLRALFLIRTDNNYFGHANAYAYPVDPAAAGVQLNLGGELLPRLTLYASGLYAINGADRDSAQLRLQSGAVLGMVRWTFARAGDTSTHVDAALQGGLGRYFIKETYLDPAISPQTYAKDAGDWGGTVGVQGSLTFSGFVAVVGYGFHTTPAAISDRIGGTVQAGGHEISLGVGVSL
jgi:hypothetical protein